MIEKMYYDTFIQSYVLNKPENDGIYPPERFIPTYRGADEDIIIECYEVNTNGCNEKLRTSIAFTLYEYRHSYNSIIRRHEAMYSYKIRRLLYWTIPCKLFDKYVNEIQGETE